MSSSATVHFGVAFGSPISPGGRLTEMSFMFSVGTPFASTLKSKCVVDSNGCEPACVSALPSALVVDALSDATHQFGSLLGHAGTGALNVPGGFAALALAGSRTAASRQMAAARVAISAERRPVRPPACGSASICVVIVVSLLTATTYAFTVTGTIAVDDEPAAGR